MPEDFSIAQFLKDAFNRLETIHNQDVDSLRKEIAELRNEITNIKIANAESKVKIGITIAFLVAIASWAGNFVLGWLKKIGMTP